MDDRSNGMRQAPVPTVPDPNVNAYRPDLAAAELRGVVAAERFVEGERRQAGSGTVPLRERPDDAAQRVSELLFGEDFIVYESRDGWAWGQCAGDQYVGYARAEDLRSAPLSPTHKIGVLRAHVFSEPDLKSRPLDQISLGSLVSVTKSSGIYVQLADGGWLHRVALAPLETKEPDFVETALRFRGVPYLWGGRSSLGLDCSGLAQVALGQAGIACPRDSYMQLEAVGEPAPMHGPYRRGDLVVFPNHCGLMVDETHIVHANATAMCVSVDRLAGVVQIVKNESDGVGIIGVRRMSNQGRSSP